MSEVATNRRRATVLGRVVVFWGGYIVILFVMAIAKAMVPERWSQLVWGTLSSVAIFSLALFVLRREGRSVREAGMNFETTSILRFLAGALIGLAIYAFNILLATIIAGPIRFTWTADVEPSVIVLSVCSFAALSCMEEIGFRGYPLRTLVPRFGLWHAQGIVAVAFGLCHLAFGWSIANTLFGVVPSALLFGMVAIASRGLAMPIGVHAALNFARWAAGENNAAGIWTMVVDAQTQARLATVAPSIGVAVTLLATIAFWRWHESRRSGISEPMAYAIHD